jgi:hypothetical protein
MRMRMRMRIEKLLESENEKWMYAGQYLGGVEVTE